MNNKFCKKIIASAMVIMLGAYTLPIYAFANEEAVYTKLDAEGKSYKTIVTTKQNEEIKQEESNKELPLETKITYTLDGKEISAKDIAGKSGKVSIKIEYKNKSAKQEYINGKYETMYTPFVVAVGSIIDNKNNKNIKVTNGKVIENGEKSIVVGIVMPGMEESLNLTGELADIEIPSSIEITMDSTNFEMKNIMSYASPRVFEKDIDWSKLNDLFDKANLLKTSIDQIEEGANALRDGISTLNDGATQLNNGASKLDNGAAQLNNGATALNNGIYELQAGVTNAGAGISSLKKGTSGVATGAELVNAGAKNLKDGLNTLDGKTQSLQTGMTKLSQSVSQLNAGAKNLKAGVDGLYSQLSAYSSKAEELEQLINANKAVLATVESGSQLATILQNNINALESEKALLQKTSKIGELVTATTQISNGLNALDQSTKTLPDTAKALADGVTQLSNGATKLANGTSDLSDGAKQLDGGATQLVNGATALKNGVNSLKQGAGQLQNGTGDLSQGAKQLSEGTTSLVDGTNKLKEGSVQLAEGIHKYNVEGITKITNFINGDLYNLKIRAQRLEQLSKDYNKFNSDEARDEIKFISIIDSVKTSQKDEEKQEIVTDFGEKDKEE
ncbi:MAG: hypothetical protein J5881_05240 [Clostridia bacterium]|nr:hypothetical protein [Clostridia bacterium]